MRQASPKPKLLRAAARHADLAESEPQDRSDVDDADHAESAHRTAKRGRRPRQSAAEISYPVGYGRPPKHGQFKPGQSGNPKGRLPRKRNFKTMVKQVVEEQVQLLEGGKKRCMPKLEALFRTIISRAFKGDPKFVASFLVILKQSGYGSEATEVGPELPPGVDHEAVLKEYLGRLGREDPAGDDCSAEYLPGHDSPAKKGKP